MRRTVEIRATKLVEFSNGMKISLTDKAGTVWDGVNKDGSERILSYAAGSPILHRDDGGVVCGPIDFSGAKAFAIEIVEGSHRAATEPGALLRLATALLSLMEAGDAAGAIALVAPAEVEEAV